MSNTFTEVYKRKILPIYIIQVANSFNYDNKLIDKALKYDNYVLCDVLSIVNALDNDAKLVIE